jgi:hypothetical protein
MEVSAKLTLEHVSVKVATVDDREGVLNLVSANAL